MIISYQEMLQNVSKNSETFETMFATMGKNLCIRFAQYLMMKYIRHIASTAERERVLALEVGKQGAQKC